MVHTLTDLPFFMRRRTTQSYVKMWLSGRLGCNGRKSRIPRVDLESQDGCLAKKI